MTSFLDPRLPERFWSKCVPEPNSGCWLWRACTNRDGYGRFASGKARSAHRVSYAALVGEIPEGLHLDHLCRTRCCVNPRHLEAVTNAENVRRGEVGIISGGLQRAKQHCPRGHAYDAANTLIGTKGERTCRECKRAKSREWQRKRPTRNREYRADLISRGLCTSGSSHGTATRGGYCDACWEKRRRYW